MSHSSTVPLQIAGYNVLPLSLPPLPSFPQTAIHYLYLAIHQPKIPTPTASRSLFLVNIPFDSTDIHIKHLLSAQIGLPAGRIEDVQFEGQRRKGGGMEEASAPTPTPNKKSKKRKRGSGGSNMDDMEGAALPSVWDRDLQTNGLTAVVLFVDRASMDAALKAVRSTRKERREPIWGEGLDEKVPGLGFASWSLLPKVYRKLHVDTTLGYLNHHRLSYPNKAQLLESVNTYMMAFANKESSNARSLARQRQVADADGFITVTRGGRTNPARQEVAQEQAEKQKEKQRGLDDFYRFQSREKRKQKAGELLRKFEEDKEKIRKMRDRRGKFRVGLCLRFPARMLMLVCSPNKPSPRRRT